MFRYCLILTVLLSIEAYGQVDTEFWFAPPEVTAGHGDRPLYLRISTLDKASLVKVFQPGRGNVQIASVNVPANTTHTIDLTSQINYLETISPAKVMQTGIRIFSSTPVTAYYEVGAPWNSDIFALKGRNALGNRFVIPAQNFYHSSGTYNPLPSSSFDIVATENNTVVRVRPSRPIFGHETDTLIVIKLNAGETYSFRKTTLLASDNAAGTIVEANKPIAITIKDDSVINGACRDLLGDQLIPVAVAGSEYVVLQGFLSTPEFLFITATEDETRIFIGGNPLPSGTLSAGETYRHQVTEKSTYVTSDKTIYVFHVTGFGCEMGLAILPSINCKGSPQIGFSRTTDEFFGLNVLVRKEGISNFVLNGSSSMIPATAFTAVPGTADKWYTAQMNFNTAEIPVGRGSLISNTQSSFQVGVINGNASSTCRYGYFSSFSTLFIGDDLDFCEGAVATLDAGPEKETYLWNTGVTTQKINVSDAGKYWVKVEREECVLYDTIKVSVKKGEIDIGSDVEICMGDTARVDGKENFSWRWSDSSTEQFLNATQAGKYWVSVHDYTGCVASDTINITVRDLPEIDLGADILKCKTDAVTLDATRADVTYVWNDGLPTPTRVVDEDGVFWVTLTRNGCSASDTILVSNLPGPLQDSIYGTSSVCPYSEGIDYQVDPAGGSTYQWFVKGGDLNGVDGHAITVGWRNADASAFVKALVTDEVGCRGDTIRYPVRINVVLDPEIPEGPDTLCLNKSQQVTYTTPITTGSVYQWSISGGEITSGQGKEDISVNWLEGNNKLWITETSVTSDTVCKGTSSELSVYVFQDTTDISLNYVSVDTATGGLLDISWKLNQTTVQGNELLLFNRARGSNDWQTLVSLTPENRSFQDTPDFPAHGIFEYYLGLTNFCDESLQTAIHNNMFLSGTADSVSGIVSLTWNHYLGWPEGVDHYEIWRKTDSDSGYRLLFEVPPHENAFARPMAADAFHHRYVIRALQKNGPYTSWSTPLAFSFKHPITIPNIITPNGDPFNQYFHISRIELYKNAELRILDRWGKEVFHSVNYRNTWDGGGLSAGVYFYVLNLKKTDQVYKGTLTIL